MNSDLNKRHKRVRAIALVLLFFLGLSALPAAIFLIADPSGESMKLPLYLLDRTLFSDFLVPGILLGLFNGILSLLFAILVLRKNRLQSWMPIFQGITLLAWLTTEIFMGIFYPLLTLPYFLVAFLLISCGLVMRLSKSGLS